MRKIVLSNDEYYHVYNRGVEKRSITEDSDDVARFMQSINDFNSADPIGSIYEKHYHDNHNEGEVVEKANKDKLFGNGVSKKLVEVVAYCLNPNHFHFLLRQTEDDGIAQFMQRLGGGYTKYFNHKHKRVGPLFQGPFKAIHVENDEYLLHLSAYINLNNKVHHLNEDVMRFHRSSWDEYLGKTENGICSKEVILERFATISDYSEYAKSAVSSTIEGRENIELNKFYFE